MDARGGRGVTTRLGIGGACALLLVVGACSGSPTGMALETSFAGTSCTAIKQADRAGVYRGICTADEKHEAELEGLKPKALIEALEAAQRDGYTHASWTGPAPAALGHQTKDRLFGTVQRTDAWRGIEYIVTGLRGSQPNSQPIQAALAEARAQATAAPAVAVTRAETPTARLQWPVEGSVIVQFNEMQKGKGGKGIMIQTTPGAIVRAVDAGQVAFGGTHELLITHAAGYSGAYSCLRDVLVKTSEVVVVGQPIGIVGKCPDAPEGTLIFAVHRRGYIDPLSLLPSR